MIKFLLIAIITVIVISVGTFFFWWIVFHSSSQSEIPPQPPPTNEQTWDLLEDFADGYSIEYPIGSIWHTPSYTSTGSVHGLQISRKDEFAGPYFTMRLRITSDQQNELLSTIQAYTESSQKSQEVTFKGQRAAKITSSKETSYIYARNNAIWIVQQPRFSDPEKIAIAERILDSFTILTPQQVTQAIQLRDGSPENATQAQIDQMKLRDNIRKTDLASLQTILKEHFRLHGQYPIATAEERIYKGKEVLSSLHAITLDQSSIFLRYSQIPGDPKEDFYYTYTSPKGTSYLLTARLEQGEEADCDRSLSQQICLYAIRP